MPPETHTRISPSMLKRVIHCPGSVALLDTVPRKGSAFAEEGSAAHFAAEACLKNDWGMHDQLGWGIGQSSDGSWFWRKDATGTKYPVTQEMAEAVQMYLDAVRQTAGGDGKILVEQRVFLDHWTPGISGTADATVVHPFEKLTVFDLKYGQGVRVDAVSDEGEPNPQLMCYALGALGPENEHMVEDVEIVAVQPRYRGGPHISSLILAVDEVYAWAADVLIPAVAAASKPDAPLYAGEWCRSTFCDAYSVCPKVRDAMFSEIEVREDNGVPVPVRLPSWEELTPDQRGRLLDALTLFDGWSKDIREAAHADALRGVSPTGYKRVAGRATRKWADPEQVEAKLSRFKAEIYEVKLKTVAEMEKMIKGQGLDPAVALDGLVETSRGVLLAPATDKRPELPAPVDEMFAVVDADDPLA